MQGRTKFVSIADDRTILSVNEVIDTQRDRRVRFNTTKYNADRIWTVGSVQDELTEMADGSIHCHRTIYMRGL